MSSELSSTISRLRQISRSPFSTFRIMSKLSSVPHFFLIMVRTTSSRIRIMVGRSMFLNFANSANDSLSTELFMLYLFKRYYNIGFHNVGERDAGRLRGQFLDLAFTFFG